MRSKVAFYDHDRYFAPDITAVQSLVEAGEFHRFVPGPPAVALMAPFKYRAGRSAAPRVDAAHRHASCPRHWLAPQTEAAGAACPTPTGTSSSSTTSSTRSAPRCSSRRTRATSSTSTARPITPTSIRARTRRRSCRSTPSTGKPLYRPGRNPTRQRSRSACNTYWKPYHAQLSRELERLKAQHGYALLWDAHSIFSVLPRFFAGKLPDLNLGTADGRSCGSGIGEGADAESVEGYGAVLNGRFKGGYITRHYGDPANGVHAVQLELSEATYMERIAAFSNSTSRWRSGSVRSSACRWSK